MKWESCTDDKHLPPNAPGQPHQYLCSAQSVVLSNTHELLLIMVTPAGHKHTNQTANEQLRHQKPEAVWSMCKVKAEDEGGFVKACCLPFRGGYRGNTAVQSSEGNTFLTSAILSFLEAGFSLVSGGVCWDFEPVDSLSDSDWLSEDSELLFDSLPCSLSDWLAESEPEASSDAEWLMVKKEEIIF